MPLPAVTTPMRRGVPARLMAVVTRPLPPMAWAPRPAISTGSEPATTTSRVPTATRAAQASTTVRTPRRLSSAAISGVHTAISRPKAVAIHVTELTATPRSLPMSGSVMVALLALRAAGVASRPSRRAGTG